MGPDRRTPRAGRTLLVAAIAAAGCGRVGFDVAAPCTADADCDSGHCVDDRCCETACAGTCARCTTGTCTAVPAACTGDCSACVPTVDGFLCGPDPAACTMRCASAVCAGSDTTFACDLSSCCATGAAPNASGSCATAVDVLLPTGCRFEYDYTSCCTGVEYIEVTWDVQECQGGAWVGVDSGADAFPCAGCAAEVRNAWTDTCGDATARTVVCP